MRTTIDLPDPLFRRTKALAVARGSTMKDLIIHALEREVNPEKTTGSRPRRVQFPLIRSKGGPKLDLSNFDFDDLLT
jgi:hypothetical protein